MHTTPLPAPRRARRRATALAATVLPVLLTACGGGGGGGSAQVPLDATASAAACADMVTKAGLRATTLTTRYVAAGTRRPGTLTGKGFAADNLHCQSTPLNQSRSGPKANSSARLNDTGLSLRHPAALRPWSTLTSPGRRARLSDRAALPGVFCQEFPCRCPAG